MKKMKPFILIALVATGALLSISVQAKIWRVNNRPGIAADFTTAQAAHNGATAGDTLFFEPSPTSYGSITLSKKLIIIGTGYFLDQNPETQWKNNWFSSIGGVTFNAGSKFSEMQGISCTWISINDSNITIKRNRISSYPIEIKSSNIIFVQNYCDVTLGWPPYTVNVLSTSGLVHNINVSNNIFKHNGYEGAIVGINLSVSYNGNFTNNVFAFTPGSGSVLSQITLENFVVQNNIFSKVNFYPNNSIYSYNIADNTTFGNLYGNQQNVNMATVFLYTGSNDGQFQLKPGSPAIGAGVGGVDCGAFGGLNPYVLSGMPKVPAIYDIMVGNGTSPYNVQMKVKAHN